MTPRAINSDHCKFEFEGFLGRERELGRADLIFPILYVPVPALASEAQWRNHPVLSVIGKRQYVNWQTFRYADALTPAMREEIARFCNKIADALHRTWLAPEERKRQEEAQAQAERPQQEGTPSAGLRKKPKRSAGTKRRRLSGATRKD